MSVEAQAYFLEAAGQRLVRRPLALGVPAAGEAIVEIDACGLCHTDLGFADGSVAPKHALPLVLGHEIVGRVVEVGDGGDGRLVGARVLVPAVLPCGDCAFCRAGRGNACPRQQMPGNDVHGGFATHIRVAAGPLVRLDDAPSHVDVRELSVVADAVSTAYQAVRRSGLAAGDAAFVVGAGGVGGYVVQIAHALGAKVVALDVDDGRLSTIAAHGADATVSVKDRAPRDVRKIVHGHAGEWKIASLAFRVFECSGTPDGQTLAYTLLGPAATMVQVGFTRRPVELRLSNLMAFDATLHGSWGAPPSAYPDVLRLVYDRKIALSPFVEHAPMSRLDQALADMAAHRLTRRLVLDPRS